MKQETLGDELLELALNALPAGIAILDGAATVVAANAAWYRLRAESGCPLAGHARGSNYLAGCEAAGSEERGVIGEVTDAVRAVLAGERAEWSIEYDRGPETRIAMRLRRIADGGGGRLLITLEAIPPRAELNAPGKSDGRFRSLIENASDVITILDAEGTIQYESPSAERVLGHESAGRLNRSFFDFIHADDFPLMVNALTAALQGPRKNIALEYRCQHRDGSWRILEGTAKNLLEDPTIGGVVVNSREITERKTAEHERARLTAVMDSTPDFVGTADPHGRLSYLNRAARKIIGVGERTDASGMNLTDLHSGSANERLLHEALPTAVRDGVWTGETSLLGSTGREIPVLQVILAHKSAEGVVEFFSTIARDITERKKLESELRQAQRLEAIGHLAAGIAHEINTPIQYVGDNIRFLEESFTGVAGLIEKYHHLMEASRQGPVAADILAGVEEAVLDMDLEYVLEEFPRAAAQSLDGVERVAEIVHAMKEFSHPGTAEKTPTDINRAIVTTVTVARSEWKYVAEIVTDLDPALPLTPCLPGDFNQALLNIIVNAAHAIADRIGETGAEKGTITIATRRADGQVEIRIGDTGSGIPESVQGRIFDPFFTTKEVGRGTGQGLTLARAVIVEKHGGTLDFETQPGEGTVFILRLPLAEPLSEREVA